MKNILLVKDIMATELVSIPYDATIKEAAEILHKGRFSGGPVIDKAGNLVGVISEKDLFRALYPTYREIYQEEDLSILLDPQNLEDWLKDAGGKKIKDILQKPITTTPQTPLVKAAAVMLARGIHRLPVLDNGKLVGIISRRSIYRRIFNHIFGFDNNL